MESEKGIINKKLLAVMADLKAIGKDQVNSFQQYKFRGIDDVLNALHPVLVNHGVMIVPEVLSREVTYHGEGKITTHVFLTVKYTAICEDGSEAYIGPVIGEAMDTSDKATNKAMSAAYKYAIFQLFCIPTEDMPDADNDHPQAQAKSQPETVGKTEENRIKSMVLKSCGGDKDAARGRLFLATENAGMGKRQVGCMTVEQVELLTDELAKMEIGNE